MRNKVQYFIIILSAYSAVAAADALYLKKYSGIRDFPHQASIGGISAAIISKNWVVTADRIDHPWLNNYPSKYVVRAGAFFLGDTHIFEGSYHHVDKVIKYEEKNRTSDHKGPAPFSRIILMRVKESFEFDDIRKPIKLSKSGEILVPGTIANVSGFEVFEWTSLRLESAKVPMMDRELCNKTYQVDLYLDENFEVHTGIPDGYICADYSGNTFSDSYAYNWAGTVTVHDKLVGIFSPTWGEQVLGWNPKLFIDIAYHREWIEQHIDQPLL